MALQFDSQLEIAARLVVRSRIFFDIWWLYEGEPHRKNLLPAMNEFPEFFRYDSYAHLVSFIIHIAALYEPRDNAISIPTIVRACEKHKHVPDDVLVEVTALLNHAKTVAKAPILIRHKAIAHRSAELDYEMTFKMAKATPNDLRDLTEVSLSILNKMLIARGLPNKVFWEPAPKAAKALLERLRPLED